MKKGQDSNLDLLNSGQVLLPTESWSSAIRAKDR